MFNRDPSTNEMISTPEGIEKIFQRYYQEPAAVDREKMKQFLNSLNLPSVVSTKNDKLTAVITIED